MLASVFKNTLSKVCILDILEKNRKKIRNKKEKKKTKIKARAK